MRWEDVQKRFPDFDTSDVDRWIGVPLGGAHMRDDVHVNDIRRWAQGMQNPNPLYYDAEYAGESRFGEIVAQQSFSVCTDDSHGAAPAIQGTIPNTHMIFGGDEWWFYGQRIRAGDRIRQDRMLFDYKVAETKFAGPTMFSRGDTTYISQVGLVVAKQRSTSVRYRADDARDKALFMQDELPTWTDAELADLEKQKFEYIQSIRDLGHDRRLFVKEGDALPQSVIGPHTVASFTTEWRSYLMTVWGAAIEHGETSTMAAGWLPEMSRDEEGAKIDPANADGLYKGPSRGHVQARYAQLIGMPRSYGYGASMGAWIVDYLSNWGGEWSFITHSNMQYRAPALTGDATFLNGEVIDLSHDDPSGHPVATVRVVMTTQDGDVMAQGNAEMLLPQP